MKRKPIPNLFTAAFVLIVLALSPRATMAQERLSFITDAEIEHIIREFATPLFQVAGLDPNAVRIFLVNDSKLNAFVAGGQNLFINTGLLMRSDSANQVIGVIAHETGHISGGHLARFGDEASSSAAQSIMAMVLAGAAAAAGRPDVGQAIALGGQHVALSGLLKYSRTQEGAADQAALKFLDASRQSSKGLMDFMQILGSQELVGDKYQDPYVRTHPLSADRVLTIREHVANSPYSDVPPSSEFVAKHRRMVVKLKAFLNPVAQTMREFPASYTSLEARYARAIALYRRPDLQAALAEIDGLLGDWPNDPFFRELKGQILFEYGNVNASIEPYRESARIVPDATSIRVALARALIESGDTALLDEAVENLQAALVRDPDSPFVWRQLGIAYGRQGKTGLSDLALAEEAIRRDRSPEAKFYAGRAARAFPTGSVPWIQAQDILRAIENTAEKNKR
ncbi:MAG: M48 family metalloprotease [Proteobacteria bacterium]|nr:M48 family metalloprotease [Pseudomonadota bacterium]